MKKISILLVCFIIHTNILIAQNVGIGIVTPAEKLDVSGNIKGDTAKLNSLKLAPNAGVGKVLTSDVDGVATWQNSETAAKTANGLNKSADSIKLGGIINETTAIRLNANTFVITDTGSTVSLSITQPDNSLTFPLSVTATTQTFTANTSGIITSAELYVAAFGGSSITLQVKDAANNILASASNVYGSIFNNWSSFIFSNLLVTENQLYNLSITSTGTTQIHYDNSNLYLGGTSSIGALADIAFKIFTAAEKNLLFLHGNRVGVNTNLPDATLDINGSLKIKDGNQGTGKLLMSDAAGMATWQNVNATALNGWGVVGNTATTAANFIGTTDNKPLVIKTNNIQSGLINHNSRNYFIGQNAGISNTVGTGNIAFGHTSLQNNTSGSSNIAIGNHALGAVSDRNYLIAIGDSSLKSNSTGEYNIAIGNNSLKNNTTGRDNLVLGNFSLRNNVSGVYNTAIGNFALADNTTGSYNVAIGTDVLANNTIGQENMGIGPFTLYNNLSGVTNYGIGHSALGENTTGSYNLALGHSSMYFNTSGNDNIAIGYQSLLNNTTGTMNTGVGTEALRQNSNSNWNTALGYRALKSNVQAGNTAVGQLAGGTCLSCIETTFIGRLADASTASMSNAAAIGARALVNTSNKVRIGNTSVTVIEGQVGWSWPSDGRFKTNVQQDVPGLQLVNLLRPVSYNFETEKFEKFLGKTDEEIAGNKANYMQASQIRQTGLIAQELETALNQVGYNFSGLHKPQTEYDNYGIAYDNFIPVLIKALQELDAKAKAAEKTNDELKKQLLQENKELRKQLVQLEQKINSLVEKEL
jgi:trimeric autotransporter adhesin